MGTLSAVPLVTSGASILGLAVGVVLLILLLGALGVFVVVIVANRAEPDPSERRPFVVYLFGVSFIAVWIALIGSSAIVASVVQLLGSNDSSANSLTDSVTRGAVLGFIIVVVSLIVLVTHLKKGLSLIGSGGSLQARRVAQSYVAAVSFTSVIILAIALGVLIYSICEIAGPGVFGGGGGRIPPTRRVLDGLYVVLASSAILVTHLRLAEPPLWRRPRTEAVSEGQS